MKNKKRIILIESILAVLVIFLLLIKVGDKVMISRNLE